MDGLLDVARGLLDSPWVYVVVALLTYADCFVPLVPSDEVLISVAALAVASDEQWVLPGLFAAGVVGALLGDSTGFWIGGRLPRERLRRRRRLGRGLDLAERLVRDRGPHVIVTARFLPVVRIGVNLVAGGALRYRTWLPLATAGCSLWAAFTVVIGAVAGFGLSDRPILAMVIGMGVGFTAGVVIDRVLTRRNAAATAVVGGD